MYSGRPFVSAAAAAAAERVSLTLSEGVYEIDVDYEGGLEEGQGVD